MVYIKKLEITAFGKFKNFQMEFENGFNEFIFENEFGKSTLTDFIIFMLYGFTKSNSKKLALEDNLLKKYLPWDDDEKISGAMELEYNQKIYRIERLQRKAGTGPCSVYDLTGAQISIQESPGEYFFKVDKDTFLRTFIVRQADMLFAKTDGIETALKNLVTTGDEDSSFEDALENLKEQKKK